MVQDSDDSVLDVLKITLESEGFIVIAVLNCDEEALKTIEDVRPNAVMLDYKLAGEDCIDICRRIKDKFPHLPVIALSCNVNIHEQYAKQGFDAYIKKPFDPDLLYSK